MKNIITLAVLLSVVLIVTLSGCQLNPQDAKQKMAFNNLMADLKATSMMEGKIGNVKYIGNAIEFDFTDASMEKEDMEVVIGHVITNYANNNNSAGTGITALKAFGKVNGKRALKVVYNAGPSHSVEGNLTFTWLDGSAVETTEESTDETTDETTGG